MQIAKEPMGTKGARITMHVSLPGKYLVYMPIGDLVGVSKRIGDDRERRRLRDIVSRREAERAAASSFAPRARTFPRRTSSTTSARSRRSGPTCRPRRPKTAPPALLHGDLDLVLRSVRDMLSTDVDQIVLDTEADFVRTRAFVGAFLPGPGRARRNYYQSEPIFDRFGVEEQITRATEPKVWLKSGGYLVIDQGEALTMIDVNTGRFVGKRSQEETVLKTNLEAVVEIVSQLRLRNIGGIIILDLIDMEDPANRKLRVGHARRRR